MERYVITINRQFGSMGRPIARHLSELLKINYYDRDIVEQTAGKLNLSVSTISAAEDYVKSRFSFMRYPLGADMQAKQDEIYHAQEEIIRDFAAKESCIIVGRCADYVLRDDPNAALVNLFVHAPMAAFPPLRVPTGRLSSGTRRFIGFLSGDALFCPVMTHLRQQSTWVYGAAR